MDALDPAVFRGNSVATLYTGYGVYGYGYIHIYPRKIGGYGYGWEISYPRQAWHGGTHNTRSRTYLQRE